MSVTQIFETFEDFEKRADKSINGVSPDFAAIHPNFAQMNLSNKGCFNCIDCDKCIDCIECYKCHMCEKCRICWSCFICENCVGAENISCVFLV